MPQKHNFERYMFLTLPHLPHLHLEAVDHALMFSHITGDFFFFFFTFYNNFIA